MNTNPNIVHQNIDSPKTGQRCLHKVLVLSLIADICENDQGRSPHLPYLSLSSKGCFFIHISNDDTGPFFRHFESNPLTNPFCRAGHQGDTIMHLPSHHASFNLFHTETDRKSVV